MKRLLSMKKKLAVVWFFLFMNGLWAQSSAVLDGIIENPSINWSQGAYLVLVGSGQLVDSASPQQGYEQLSQLGWIPFFTGPDTPINLSDYCYLLARIWSVKGGFFYTALPSPRYAYREFKFQGYASSGTDPSAAVSGAEAIRMLGKVMDSNPAVGAKK
jgi:hypothetical protein